jgi:hypothetical protein
MQDMLSYLIARDSMHQQQWLAVIEDMGKDVLPIPNSFDRSKEATEFSTDDDDRWHVCQGFHSFRLAFSLRFLRRVNLAISRLSCGLRTSSAACCAGSHITLRCPSSGHSFF